MRGSGIMGPWEIWRKIGLGLSFAVLAFLFVILYLPVGFVALGLLVAASWVWKQIGQFGDPRLGTYTPNTFPYRMAAFFTALRMRFNEVKGLQVLFGFGPPSLDRDHDLEPGWLPPTRLSSYWSLLGALALGLLDPLLTKAHYPIVQGLHISGWIIYPFSVLGFFGFFQLINAVRRIQGDADSISATEPRPAVMIHKSRAELPLRELIPRSAVIGGSLAMLVILIGIVTHLALWITASIAVVVLAFGLLITASRMMTAKYNEGWAERNARREYWVSVFSFLRDKTPILMDEVELPTPEQFQATEEQRVARANRAARNRARQTGEEPVLEEPRMYEPQVKVAIFQFPPNSTFADYRGQENRINGVLGVELCAISPIGQVVGEAEVPGTIGSAGFRVWHTELEPPHFLDAGVDDWMREFLVRSRIIPALATIRGMGWPTLLSTGMITRPESERRIIEVKVNPPQDTNLETFLNSLEAIRTSLDVQWVRVGKLGKGDGGANTISLFIGDFPDFKRTRFINPQTLVRKQIDEMDWLYYFNAQNLRGINGVPKLVERRPATEIVDKLVFKLPDGMPFEAIGNKKSPLMSTSGYLFMEIEQGDEDDTRRMSEQEKIENEARQEARFTLIASKSDPLKRVFNFGDYKDKIMPGRTPGQERIDWYGGVLADDSLAKYSWDSEEPHLLIAGSSGSGKALEVNTPIYTANGWRRMGDVKVGDIVFDLNGKATRVVEAFDEYDTEFAYDVEFDDGEVIRASGNHLWSVVMSENRYVSTVAALRKHARLDALTHPQLALTIARLRTLSNDLSSGDAAETRDLLGWGNKEAYFIDADGTSSSAEAWIRKAEEVSHSRKLALDRTVKTSVLDAPAKLKEDDAVLEQLAAIEREALSRPRYDAMGIRVATVGEIARMSGYKPEVISAVIADARLVNTSQWRFPQLGLDEVEGITLRVSEPVPLYRVEGVIRHLANAHAEREQDIESVSPELTVLTSAEIARSFVSYEDLFEDEEEFEADPFLYAIPFRGIGGTSGLAASDTEFRDHDSHMAHRYITSVREVFGEDNERVPVRVRCISVDSPTHTYRAGKGLVATHNSVVSSSMILQLAYNNAPSEAIMWMIEPKNEMQVYRDVDVVRRFVDSWTPDDQFMTNAANLMEDAVAEMERRNKVFTSHPKQPKKLAKSREIAKSESAQNGTPLEDHPLYMPYLFIILEECATLFADAAGKEERMEQGRLLAATAEIARKSRSAGIYLVCLTQYPTNASIPSVIRNQMNRIGLKCQNDLASRIVIGENGLEQIKTKGVGMIKQNGTFRSFRGFWVKDGDPDNNEPNDILDTIRALPTKGNVVVGSGGVSHPELFIPDPSTAVFNAWDSRIGAGLAQAIDDRRPTRDKVDAEAKQSVGAGSAA